MIREDSQAVTAAEPICNNRNLIITGIVGSPRKAMNSDTLTDAVLEGCKSMGASVNKIYLNDLDMKPCQACRIQDGKGCRINDGMNILQQVFENSDGIVLGIPVYYGLMSSQVKLMVDRSYCLAEKLVLPSGEVIFRTNVKKRKKGITICVSNSYQSQQSISDCLGSWGSEINLSMIKEIFISHSQLGVEAKKSEATLREMFLLGELLYEEILNV